MSAPTMTPGTPSPPERPGVLRYALRALGLVFLLASAYPFWEALRALDRRDYVSSLLAGFVGWFVVQAGVELVRPESAE